MMNLKRNQIRIKMWTVIKINSKRIFELKKDFNKKLGSKAKYYQPKYKIEKVKNRIYIKKSTYNKWLQIKSV